MSRALKLTAIAWLALGLASEAGAQETPAAKATRKRLQQKITVEFKDVGTKALLDDVKGEMDMPVSIKIKNETGISNNAKLTYKGKDKTVEQVLNELSDVGEFGWFVKSDAKDREDGFVIIRKFKDKERGYESGKEPKK